jgi:hypothetical protein
MMEFVSWDDDIPNIWKNHQPEEIEKHQPRTIEGLERKGDGFIQMFLTNHRSSETNRGFLKSGDPQVTMGGLILK